jgi:hypothetical protein
MGFVRTRVFVIAVLKTTITNRWNVKIAGSMTMPNWCANRVTVYGDKLEISKFAEFVKSEGEAFCFESVIPIPAELYDVQSPVVIVDTEAEVEVWIEEHSRASKEGFFVSGHPITKDTQMRLLMEYNSDNWYDWSCDNWGVKWDARDVDLIEDIGELQYTFDTPWGPPEPVCVVLREKFPDLAIEWFWDEPGMQVAGYL